MPTFVPQHPVNRNNCSLPLRQSPDNHVCGDLHAIKTRTESMKDSITNYIPWESSAPPLDNSQQDACSPSITPNPAASPAAGSASADCAVCSGKGITQKRYGSGFAWVSCPACGGAR